MREVNEVTVMKTSIIICTHRSERYEDLSTACRIGNIRGRDQKEIVEEIELPWW